MKKLLKVAAFVICSTSFTILFKIHQRFKGHFLDELRISAKVLILACENIETFNIFALYTFHV